MTSPEAVNVLGLVDILMVAVVRSNSASAICDAIARFQINSYNRCALRSMPGFINEKSVGRMAS